MATARLHRCLEPGLSVLVGTTDLQGMPSTCRGIALASQEDLRLVTVFVPVATSHETIQNIAKTKRLAVTATHPIDHSSTQLKGTAVDVRLARDDEAAFVRARLDAYADVLDTVGVPRRLTRSVTHWPAFAVSVRVDQIFDQTPGPNAGGRLQ